VNNSVLTFAKKHRGKISGNVLEVGSQIVNGTVRDVLAISVGCDMVDGPGVDQVVDSSGLLVQFGPDSWDCVVSCDALEHMAAWKDAIENMWGVLKPEGLLFLTLANPRKGYHGYPSDYWRWPMERFKLLFGQNEILDTFFEGPSMGVLVRKGSHPLDLSIKPDPVRR